MRNNSGSNLSIKRDVLKRPMPNVMHLSSRFPLVFFLVAIALVANSLSEWPYTIRFMYSSLNGLIFAVLTLFMTVSLALIGRAFASRRARYLTFFGIALLSIPMLLFSLMAVLNPVTTELQDSLPLGSVTYRVYVRNPYFVTAQPFTILRKELDTPFGFKLVRTIWANERYGKARLHSVNSSTLEIEIDGDFFRESIKI